MEGNLVIDFWKHAISCDGRQEITFRAFYYKNIYWRKYKTNTFCGS